MRERSITTWSQMGPKGVRAENLVTIAEQHFPGRRPRHCCPDQSQQDRLPWPSDSSTWCSFAYWAGWHCSPAPTPPRTPRSWRCDTRSRYCGAPLV